jgi:type I restriction-modification system DNA methylase subunit/restriction endonuclease S subunit
MSGVNFSIPNYEHMSGGVTMQKLSNWRDMVLSMGFAPSDGESEVYAKSYPQHNGYTIRVDIADERIEYADGAADEKMRISVGDGTTSNFSRSENFVVLECVVRLLDKGYSPSAIELEKVYPSGHGHSGRLDILVKDSGGKAFLMIECKTWGAEYNKGRDRMLKDGRQLFTYYKNATAARHLCLYASRLIGGEIEYVNSIVDVQDEWTGLSETKDIHEYWNKTFKDNGIFENYATPYNIVHKRLTYGMLHNMKADDSGVIYNHIMEILRHNGISDKPNAFNKLLNLFVCKIIDEDKNPDEELQFQCWDGLSDEKLQMTLNDLYKEGMWRFLEIRVIDYSESDVDKVLQKLGIGDTAHKQELMGMFSDTRLKKSPNFAFVEVQDEKTFRLNAKIVREIVELLQQYKFRYEQKHEFLGDFFEKMLNTSMKQEAGQFFTPVPITRFIISSMPLREFVQGKIDGKESDPLPAVIDYACGSGHFLTEFMSKMQTIVENADVSKASPRVRGKLNSWRGDVKFSWAKEYVYGVEFDNRLVKTAKVSAFFNGDGEATIVWGNGLDSFEYSEEYKDKLKTTLPSSKKDNGQFDVLISNPPYSVQAFKTMLKHGAKSFELYGNLTDKSSEIECLFVERMKQLLKVGGWAGVILPSSMLSNSGVYSLAREIIFKYFKVKAIVELGSGTFMKTGTNTIILFLERRADSDCEMIKQAINKFFNDGLDVTVVGIEHAYSKFVANVYDDLAFGDYVSLVHGAPSKAMQAHELWADYIKEHGQSVYSAIISEEKVKLETYLVEKLNSENIVDRVKPADITKAKMNAENFIYGRTEFLTQDFLDDISEFVKVQYDGISVTDFESFLRRIPNERMQKHSLYADYLSRVCKRLIASEQEKMLYFLLTYEQNAVVVRSGQKQDEKAFLGYEFSERRGYEGIKFLPSGTKLFDENDAALNPQKVNSYIYNAFLGKPAAEVDETMAKHVSYGRMSGFFEYGARKFDKRVNLSKKANFISEYPMQKLANFVEIVRGVTYDKDRDQVYDETENIILTADNITIDDKFDVVKRLYLRSGVQLDASKKLRKGDVFICLSSGSKDHIGKCAFVSDDTTYFAGGFMGILRKASEEIDMKYVSVILSSNTFRATLRSGSTGANIKNLSNRIGDIRIPLPPLDIQRQIVAEFEALEREEESVSKQANKEKDDIESYFAEQIGKQIQSPKDCPITGLGEIIISANNGLSRRGTDTNGSIVLRLVELQAGFIDYSNPNRMALTNSEKARYLLIDGDFLFARVNGNPDNVGRCAVFQDIGESVYHNDHIIRVRFNDALLDDIYASYLLNSEFGKAEIRKMVKTTAGQFTVSQADIRSIGIPLPPLKTQKEIVTVIEKQEAGIVRLHARIDELKAAKVAVLDKYL